MADTKRTEKLESLRARIAAVPALPLTFGVEIECKGNSRDRLERKLNAAGISNVQAESYNHTDHFDGIWKIVTDATVPGGCEVVSPVLSGPEGLAEVARVADAIKGAGSYADSDCGLHVHFGAKDVDFKVRKRFLASFTRWEKVFDALVNTERRGNNSRMARSIFEGEDNWQLINEKIACIQNCTTHDELLNCMGQRYRKLNAAEAFSQHGTYEVRQHHGTVESKEIVEWVQLLSELWRWALAGVSGVKAMAANKTLRDDVAAFGARLNYNDSDLKDIYRDRIKEQGAVTRRRRRRTANPANVVRINGRDCPCYDCRVASGEIKRVD